MISILSKINSKEWTNAKTKKLISTKSFSFLQIIAADINLNSIGQQKINKKCLILNKKINYNQLNYLI